VKIGLFGGSFDPPHLGHLALARQARDQLALDELLWIPAGRPWQKPDQALAEPAHRLAMVTLMIQGEDRMRADDLELHREGPSYTVDTVEALSARHRAAALYLVIGQDQYTRLPTWHRWRELLSGVTLAVAGREGATPLPPAALVAVWHRVVVLDLPPVAVSSTAVRAATAAGADLCSLVGDAVAGYIDRQGLYRVSPPLTTRS
jgi:nicotinate-nucleotide adenylyltransferase